MRLIDADALIKAVEDFPNCYNGWSDTYDKAFIIEAIAEAPTIDIDRPRGEWVEHKNAEEICGTLISNYECPLCHEWQTLISNFCPSCGARMRGTGDEAN